MRNCRKRLTPFPPKVIRCALRVVGTSSVSRRPPQSGRRRSLRCASSPHRTRFAGLRRGPHVADDSTLAPRKVFFRRRSVSKHAGGMFAAQAAAATPRGGNPAAAAFLPPPPGGVPARGRPHPYGSIAADGCARTLRGFFDALRAGAFWLPLFSCSGREWSG